MKLRRTYDLAPETVVVLRNHWLKAIGACVILLGFYLAMVALLGVRTGEPASFGLDAMLFLSLLFCLGSYSRGYASLRVKLARERSDEEALALLLPFVGKRARFDPDGEAMELLQEVTGRLGRKDLAKVCADYLSRSSSS